MPDELPEELDLDFSKARRNPYANVQKKVITITNEPDVDLDDDMLPEYRFDHSKARRNPYAVRSPHDGNKGKTGLNHVNLVAEEIEDTTGK